MLAYIKTYQIVDFNVCSLLYVDFNSQRYLKFFKKNKE